MSSPTTAIRTRNDGEAIAAEPDVEPCIEAKTARQIVAHAGADEHLVLQKRERRDELGGHLPNKNDHVPLAALAAWLLMLGSYEPPRVAPRSRLRPTGQ